MSAMGDTRRTTVVTCTCEATKDAERERGQHDAEMDDWPVQRDTQIPSSELISAWLTLHALPNELVPLGAGQRSAVSTFDRANLLTGNQYLISGVAGVG